VKLPERMRTNKNLKIEQQHSMNNKQDNGALRSDELALWEVFVQENSDGSSHGHVGSVRASDKEMALQNARDVYARRGKLNSIWVIPADSIIASSPGDNESFFDPSNDKIYRHPQFYKVPRGIKDSND